VQECCLVVEDVRKEVISWLEEGTQEEGVEVLAEVNAEGMVPAVALVIEEQADNLRQRKRSNKVE